MQWNSEEVLLQGNPRRMRSEGYGTWSVCLSVCLSVTAILPPRTIRRLTRGTAAIASFPGRAGEGKNGLVSIVCACVVAPRFVGVRVLSV